MSTRREPGRQAMDRSRPARHTGAATGMGHLPGPVARRSRAVGNGSPALLAALLGLTGLGADTGSWHVARWGTQPAQKTILFFYNNS